MTCSLNVLDIIKIIQKVLPHYLIILTPLASPLSNTLTRSPLTHSPHSPILTAEIERLFTFPRLAKLVAEQMGRRRKRVVTLPVFCYYCDREFQNEVILIEHQKVRRLGMVLSHFSYFS